MLPDRIVPRDTTTEADRFYHQVLRQLGPDRRASLVFEASRRSRRFLEAGVRLRHPGYDERQLRLAVMRLTLGEELFERVHPGVRIES